MNSVFFEMAVSLVVAVGGTGTAGIALAWLNDRRHLARKRGEAKLLAAADPRKMLEVRFAAGEIDEREFNAKTHRLIVGVPLELD